MVTWYPLGTIWHPLEGPGKCMFAAQQDISLSHVMAIFYHLATWQLAVAKAERLHKSPIIQLIIRVNQHYIWWWNLHCFLSWMRLHPNSAKNNILLLLQCEYSVKSCFFVCVWCSTMDFRWSLGHRIAGFFRDSQYIHGMMQAKNMRNRHASVNICVYIYI